MSQNAQVADRIPLAALPMGALLIDPSTLRIVEANPAALETLGPRAVGRCLTSLVPDADRSRVLELVDRRPACLRLAPPLDTTVDLRVSAAPSGQLLVVVEDTSERERTEGSLRKAFLTQKTLSDLMRATLDNRPLADQLQDALKLLVDLPWSPFGPHGAILVAENDAFYTAASVGRRLNVVGSSGVQRTLCHCESRIFGEFGQWADRDLFSAAPNLALVHSPLIANELCVGTLIVQGPPLEAMDPFEQEMLRVTAHHLAQVIIHVRAREEARAQAEAFRQLTAGALSAIVTFDRSGVIRSFNPAAETMFDWAEYNIVGQRADRILPDASTPYGGFTSWAQVALHNEPGKDVEIDGLRRDGSRFPARLEVFETYHEGALRWTTFVRDDTERVSAQAELVEARETALEASRAKSRFLANMSHEIRTPMNGVIGMTDLLLGTTLDDEQRDAVETIRGSGEALLSVINDVLDFSRIEAGRLEIGRQPFAIRRVARDIIRLLSTQAEDKALDLQLELQPRLSDWVEGDPGRIRQILVNLVGNALKFTERGTVRVEVGPGPEPDEVSFRVHDTGIGMTQEGLSKLFRPFAQADGSITRRFGGTGLGLTISRQLAELMEGRLEARSEYGVGSTFELVLPLRRTEAQGDMTTEDLLLVDFSGIRVLLVEDNLVNQKVARRVLEKLEMIVTVAGDGQQALDAVASQGFDIVLMDCQMPVLDGYSATRELRRRGYERPIVALTANAMKGDEEACLEAGMNAFLSKPVRKRDIETTLARMIAVFPPDDRPQ